MGIRLTEHKSYFIHFTEDEESVSTSTVSQTVLYSDKSLYEDINSKLFNKNVHRFIFEKQDSSFVIRADYCIGIDWLGNTGKFLYVEPKINQAATENFVKDIEITEDESPTFDPKTEISHLSYELDYLQMLLQVTKIPESNQEIKELVQIDWHAKPISIQQKDDRLTPFLIIRFLQILKSIVRKGLKKSYYKVQENLTNRVKGKILVGTHIKQNVFKNKLTSTFCEYQVYGENHIENQFLKKVLQFVISYVENHRLLLNQNYEIIQQSINYCRPAFELISGNISENELKHIKHNPFYKDYKEGLRIGSHILKRFGYNITQTATDKVSTPPFWIDMPRLFELYVFSKMVEHNSDKKNDIHYQFSTYGNALDILISVQNYQMIIDAKYKLHYHNGHLHDDIRQVAGYARLKKVRNKLLVEDDRNISCLIIYPDIENGISDFSLENIDLQKQEIRAYHRVYKLGVNLPLISV